MRKNRWLQFMRLSERGTSELALNVLGMSLCDLLQNRCTELALPKPVGKDFPILERVWDREKFSVASMGRRKCALWTSGTGARSTCGLTDLRVGPVGGGGAIMEIPYLALTEDFSEVRDI